jgi:hypothetical protein
MTDTETPGTTGEFNESTSEQVYTNSEPEESGASTAIDALFESFVKEQNAHLPDVQLSQALSASSDSNSEVADKGKAPELTEKLILLESTAKAELWHDLEGEAYATIVLGNKKANVKLRSREFKSWMCCKAYTNFGCAPSSQAIDAVLRMLEGKAKFEGDEFEPQVRIAGDSSATFLHLADEPGTIIKIDATGIHDASDANDASIRFLSKPGMRQLPNPAIPKSLEESRSILQELRGFCNLKDDGEWLLYLVSLLSGFRSTGPFVVVVVVGEQGSAKSTLCKVFRRLVDPSKAPLRSAPREERDLWIAASNGWIVAFDNVSRISADLSDAICRLATGGGNSYRTLYENDSETLFQCQRLVLLNTIDDLTLRGDLVDRAIQLTCRRIDNTQRLTEEEFWSEFEKREAEFLGALLSVLSTTLQKLPAIKLDTAPRMADFARFGVAVEQALDLPPGTFIAAYGVNRKALATVALENQFAELLLKLDLPLEEKPSDLWQKLHDLSLFQEGKIPRWFPANGQSLSSKLRRDAPLFRQRGIEVDFSREDSSRKISLKRLSIQGL